VSTIEHGELKSYQDTLSYRLEATYGIIDETKARLDVAEEMLRDATNEFHRVAAEIEGRTVAFTGIVIEFDHHATRALLNKCGLKVDNEHIEVRQVFSQECDGVDTETTTSIYALGNFRGISCLAQIDKIHEVI
jgi:hypothetical protein